jgi:cytosine/adenosine deaminase-related metal-dependent hydrolase
MHISLKWTGSLHRRLAALAGTAGLALAFVASPALAAGCTVTPGDAALLIQATVLTPERAIRGGEVLIDPQGNIACVGSACRAKSPAATRIECRNAILSPGFINAHEHLAFGNIPPVPDTGIRYTHRHDWRKGRNGYAATENFQPTSDPGLIAWMELRHLLAGETSMLGGNMAPGLMRNLDFFEGLEGLDAPRVTYAIFPLDDAAGIQRTADCDYGPNGATARQVTAAHAYVMHLAEGVGETARNEFRCASDAAYDTTASAAGGGIAQDLLHGNVTVQHGVGLDAAMLATLARRHVNLVWTPRSNLALYGRTLDVREAMTLRIPVALGTDWLFSGSMTLPREADCALTYMHSTAKRLTGRELWTMMTLNGARAVRMEDRVGSIAKGLVADLVLVEPHDARDGDPYATVATATPAQMLAILRGGRVLSGDADLVWALRSDADCDPVDMGRRRKLVCIAQGGAPGYAELKTRADGAGLWPAFFTGLPPIEPSCRTGRTTPPRQHGKAIAAQ